MHTLSLPIQLAGTGTNPPPQRNNSAPANGSAQFGQTLSREMAQQQHRPAPAPARQPAPARPDTAPSAPAPKPQSTQAQAQAKPADAKPATAGTDARTDEAKAEVINEAANAANAAADAANAAASNPVAALLALVASFNPPAVPLATPGSMALAAGTALSAQVAASAAALAAPALAAGLGPGLVQAANASLDPALAAAGKAQEHALAGADTAPALKDAALAIDGAARFSLQALSGDAAAKGALPVTPKPAATSSESLTAQSLTAQSLMALSGAAHKPGPDDAADQVAQGKGNVAEQALAPGAARADPAALSPASPLLLRPRDSAMDVAALKDPAPAAPVTAPVQQASLAMAQALSATPLDRIAARVGTPAWDNQVGQKIIWMVAGKEQSASMTLNPPDMGPMQVVLSVTGDHASVTFSAAQPEVSQALENALPKLREMLGESGIALGNASVNAGMPEQRQAQHGEAPRQGSNARVGGAGEAAPTAPAAPRTTRPDNGAGLVDTFA